MPRHVGDMDQIVDALAEQPGQTAKQIQRQGIPGNIPVLLSRAYALGLIEPVRMSPPGVHHRMAYFATGLGIDRAAARRGMTRDAFVKAYMATRARNNWLVIKWDRVSMVRSVLLNIQDSLVSAGNRLVEADVEVVRRFPWPKGKSTVLHQDGAGIVVVRGGRWFSFCVMYDVGQVPVAAMRSRFNSLMLVYKRLLRQRRYGETDFPVLVIVASSESRRNDYAHVLTSMARIEKLSLPDIFLCTESDLKQDDARAHSDSPWYSLSEGRRTPLFAGVIGNSTPQPGKAQWQRYPKSRRSESSICPHRLARGIPPDPTWDGFASLSRSLTATQKLVLDAVAAHPLLTANQIAALLDLGVRAVFQAVEDLSVWTLIEKESSPKALPRSKGAVGSNTIDLSSSARGERYILTFLGIRFLALRSGYGQSVRQYSHARGWHRGFSTLVRYWDHTALANEVMISLVRAARRRGDDFVWDGELESRLFYKATDKGNHSFLPDGRFGYIHCGMAYQTCLEVERGRSRQRKLRRKVSAYVAALQSNLLARDPNAFISVLVIVPTVTRIKAFRKAIIEVLEGRDDLRIGFYLTDMVRFQSAGIEAPVWHRIDAYSREDEDINQTTRLFSFFAIPARSNTKSEGG